MNLFRISLFAAFLFSTVLSANAANLGEVKSDMKKRQPAIEALWAEGKIGENNKGYIEARAALEGEERKLVQAENADRRVVYQAIARSTQTTPEKVGVQRAAQISKRAAKGLWLQDAEGNWYRK
ncbi:MAG TPA: YdbL family protein [Opitutales bacterium]|nr:YdbL family protein [Opitutales bacterium]